MPYHDMSKSDSSRIQSSQVCLITLSPFFFSDVYVHLQSCVGLTYSFSNRPRAAVICHLAVSHLGLSLPEIATTSPPLVALILVVVEEMRTAAIALRALLVLPAKPWPTAELAMTTPTRSE
jgi:hypothetical protein